jgi:prepilin-type N-terminal cleavage/methylation domain-containing protein
MQTPKFQKAFSLIELLIVIFIVALVYFLGFGAISWSPRTNQQINILNLKSSIQKADYYENGGKLICLDKCESCYFQTDINTPPIQIENPIALGDNISIYQLDKDDMLTKRDFGRFQDKKICLVMDFYKNGSSTQMVYENSNGIYFLSAYFNASAKVDSLSDAKELWLQYNKPLQNLGDFY